MGHLLSLVNKVLYAWSTSAGLINDHRTYITLIVRKSKNLRDKKYITFSEEIRGSNPRWPILLYNK